MNAISQMAQTLTSTPHTREPLVIRYTKQCEYRPIGKSRELLMALRESSEPMTKDELAKIAHMLPFDIKAALKPAIRFGIVRAVGDGWEWVRTIEETTA